MAIPETSAACSSGRAAAGEAIRGTTEQRQAVITREGGKNRELDDKDVPDNLESTRDFSLKAARTRTVVASPPTQLSRHNHTKQATPQHLLATKKDAVRLVREVSCFQTVELAEALNVIDHEIRSAMRLQLRNVLAPCTSRLSTSECRKNDSPHVAPPCGNRAEHGGHLNTRGFETGPASLLHAGPAAGRGTNGCSTCCAGVQFGRTADSGITEIVAPPFLGRRIGSPAGVHAPFALPPFRASLVDGYALHIPAGRWAAVQNLYRLSDARKHAQHGAAHSGGGAVALKIAGEVRAGAGLAGEGVQPFRGHPHISAEAQAGSRSNLHEACYESSRESTRDGCVYEGSSVAGDLQCVYVTTGAPVPVWCNAVIPVESCEVDVDNCLCWPDHHVVSKLEGSGENVREIGVDVPANTLLLEQGQLIGPAEEGMLAAVGIGKLEVFRKLDVHTLAVGDELHSLMTASTLERADQGSGAAHPDSERCPRQAYTRGDIKEYGQDLGLNDLESTSATRQTHVKISSTAAVYDSNSPMLKALLAKHCPSTRVVQQHVLPDDVDDVQRLLLSLALRTHARRACDTWEICRGSSALGCDDERQQDSGVDVLVSTGGVSMGGSDCVKLALLRLQGRSIELQVGAEDADGSIFRCEHNCPCGKPGGRITSNSTGGTSVPEGSEDTTRGGLRGTATNDDAACAAHKTPSETQRWMYAVETEIKFGRLNVKPGKPAMFAVLRVFRRNAANAAASGSDSPQAHRLTSFEELHQRRVVQQPSDATACVPPSGLTSSRINYGAPNVSSAKPCSTSHARGDVTDSCMSPPELHDLHQAPSPASMLLVLALPGNPCSAWVLFHLLVAPALNFYSSFCPSQSLFSHLPAQTFAVLDEPVAADPERPEYCRVLVYVEQSNDEAPRWIYADGRSTHGCCRSASDHALQLRAFPTGRQTSSRLLSCCASANGVVIAAPRGTSKHPALTAGQTVPVLLFGTPFPCRPHSLMRLLKSQNDLTGVQEPKCRCGGEADASATTKGEQQAAPTSGAVNYTEGAGSPHEDPEQNVCVSTTTAASHFKYGKSTGNDVGLGIVVVSDRCSRGIMKDACAETLLKVLRSSAEVAGLLRLQSRPKAAALSGRERGDTNRSQHGEIRASVRMPGTVVERDPRVLVVPDLVNSVRNAVLSMLCACAGETKQISDREADGPLPRRGVIFVLGGTGLSARDVTPQALLPLFTVRCNGIEHLLLDYSLRCTPLAALGRPCAGLIECRAGRSSQEGKGRSSCGTYGSSRASLAAEEAQQGFEAGVTGVCCRGPAFCSSMGCEGMAAPPDVPGHHEDEPRGLEAPRSIQALAETGAALAQRVAADPVQIHTRMSGCGARCMVLVFPGSPKAVKEHAEAVLPVLCHALEQL